MSGPLRGTPDNTTHHAHVANACLAAGQRSNKTPILISGFSDIRSFPVWLRASCPGVLMAQLTGKKLVVAPSTAGVLRAAISSLRSLNGNDGVRLQTFTLPEECSERLLLKNLGSVMPDSVLG